MGIWTKHLLWGGEGLMWIVEISMWSCKTTHPPPPLPNANTNFSLGANCWVRGGVAWIIILVKRRLGRESRKLPTLPFPNPTPTLTFHLKQNFGLREGLVCSFAKSYTDTIVSSWDEGDARWLPVVLWKYMPSMCRSFNENLFCLTLKFLTLKFH